MAVVSQLMRNSLLEVMGTDYIRTAKSKGLKLSEYGLVDSKNKNYHAKSERDIFKKLGLEYLPPILR